jgi:hypothetical protein
VSGIDPLNFRVIRHDYYGAPVRCSYCVRAVPHVVVLPLTPRPELEERIEGADGNELWVGLCADCVASLRVALEGALS